MQSAVLHAIALANYAITTARGRAAALRCPSTSIDRCRDELALVREELRIKDARMALTPPRQRPHYRPTDRMVILELRAARGWSLAKTAEVFMITTATIHEWMRRIDEQGEHALVQKKVSGTFLGYSRSPAGTECCFQAETLDHFVAPVTITERISTQHAAAHGR
jgi:hypothetical protein